MGNDPPATTTFVRGSGWVGALDRRVPPTPGSCRAANHLLDQVLVFCRIRRQIRSARSGGQASEAVRLAREGQRMERDAKRNALALLTTEWPPWEPPPGWADGLPWYQPERGDDGSLAWCGMRPEPATLPMRAIGPGNIAALYQGR